MTKIKTDFEINKTLIDLENVQLRLEQYPADTYVNNYTKNEMSDIRITLRKTLEKLENLKI
jgi:hypothetical protein